MSSWYLKRPCFDLIIFLRRCITLHYITYSLSNYKSAANPSIVNSLSLSPTLYCKSNNLHSHSTTISIYIPQSPSLPPSLLNTFSPIVPPDSKTIHFLRNLNTIIHHCGSILYYSNKMKMICKWNYGLIWILMILITIGIVVEGARPLLLLEEEEGEKSNSLVNIQILPRGNLKTPVRNPCSNIPTGGRGRCTLAQYQPSSLAAAKKHTQKNASAS